MSRSRAIAKLILDDARIDALDDDSDGDGIAGSDEAGDDDLSTDPVDSDDDGTPDDRSTASDGDGVEEGEDNCRLVEHPEEADVDDEGRGRGSRRGQRRGRRQ